GFERTLAMMADWLIEDVVTADTLRDSAVRIEANHQRGVIRGEARQPRLAVRFHDIVVHDNKKWFQVFGGADVRVDAIVVQGNILEQDPSTAYAPATLR